MFQFLVYAAAGTSVLQALKALCPVVPEGEHVLLFSKAILLNLQLYSGAERSSSAAISV